MQNTGRLEQSMEKEPSMLFRPRPCAHGHTDTREFRVGGRGKEFGVINPLLRKSESLQYVDLALECRKFHFREPQL